MSVLQDLHVKRVNHAVIRNEVEGVVDWFIICKKAHYKTLFFTPTGVYEHNKVMVYLIDMNKNDIYRFYDCYQIGMYELAFKNVHGLVWELKDNGFKNYIKRMPIRKNKTL